MDVLANLHILTFVEAHVAVTAERNEVMLGVIGGMAAKSFMVDLEI
jgi:hypothetical protein